MIKELGIYAHWEDMDMRVRVEMIISPANHLTIQSECLYLVRKS